MLQTFEGDVLRTRCVQIAAHRDDPDQGGAISLVSDGKLGGEIPTEITIEPSYQLELINERFASFEHLAILFLVAVRQCLNEVVGRFGSDHFAFRPCSRSPYERRIYFDISPVEIFHREHHIDQCLE